MPLDAWGMPWGTRRARRYPRSLVPPAASRLALDPRTERLLEAPIAPTLLRLAWPNIAVMLVTASTGLIETWWVSRLGLDALAGIALVFPAVHDDADAVGRRDGRRHLVGGGARPRQRPAR